MRKVLFMLIPIISLAAGAALAEPIDGRLGLTGKAGVIVPIKKSDIGGVSFDTNTNFAGGGGLIYGVCKNIAVELDVTHAPALDVKIAGAKVGEAQFTAIGLGVQYRFMPSNRLVPYIGIGGDIIKGDIEASTLDWTVGGHANAGVDYFINKSIAVTADFRYLVGAKSDITQNGVKVGKFDPMNFNGTVGVRLFLPEKWSD